LIPLAPTKLQRRLLDPNESLGAGPGLEARDERVGLERDADRILGKGGRPHIGLAVPNIIENQELDLIVVRVAVVHRGRRTMIDAPIRTDTACLEQAYRCRAAR
jgi:hypothetical protein